MNVIYLKINNIFLMLKNYKFFKSNLNSKTANIFLDTNNYIF